MELWLLGSPQSPGSPWLSWEGGTWALGFLWLEDTQLSHPPYHPPRELRELVRPSSLLSRARP